MTAEKIRLTDIDMGFCEASPLFALFRLDGFISTGVLFDTVLRVLPKRMQGNIIDQDGYKFIQHQSKYVGFSAVKDHAGLADRLNQAFNLPIRSLSELGRRSVVGQDAPLTHVTHVRGQSCDYLALSISHVAVDGVTIYKLTQALFEALTFDSTPVDFHESPLPSSSNSDAFFGYFSFLHISQKMQQTMATAAGDAKHLGPAFNRALVLRTLFPQLCPGSREIRIRIPMDLRFSNLEIPQDSVGNFFVDSLTVYAVEDMEKLPLKKLAQQIYADMKLVQDSMKKENILFGQGMSPQFINQLPNQGFDRYRDVIYTSYPSIPMLWCSIASVPLCVNVAQISGRRFDRFAVQSLEPLKTRILEE